MLVIAVQDAFSHAAFGGMAQWSKGGMSMVGDMFNAELKAKLDGMMTDLAAAQDDRRAERSQRHEDDAPTTSAGNRADAGQSPWPSEFGAPSSSGGQNDARYAFFPEVQRLIVEESGKRTTYDTGPHKISGVSQQQSSSRSLKFQSQDGEVRLVDLKVVD